MWRNIEYIVSIVRGAINGQYIVNSWRKAAQWFHLPVTGGSAPDRAAYRVTAQSPARRAAQSRARAEGHRARQSRRHAEPRRAAGRRRAAQSGMQTPAAQPTEPRGAAQRRTEGQEQRAARLHARSRLRAQPGGPRASSAGGGRGGRTARKGGL